MKEEKKAFFKHWEFSLKVLKFKVDPTQTQVFKTKRSTVIINKMSYTGLKSPKKIK